MQKAEGGMTESYSLRALQCQTHPNSVLRTAEQAVSHQTFARVHQKYGEVHMDPSYENNTPWLDTTARMSSASRSGTSNPGKWPPR